MLSWHSNPSLQEVLYVVDEPSISMTMRWKRFIPERDSDSKKESTTQFERRAEDVREPAGVVFAAVK